ncbi:hypothetical protein Tco_1047254, partial [Tanacetum coccineum]
MMNSLHNLEKLNSLEVAQTTKTKWSIEGDKKSKYFHGILNKRRNNLAIRGISVDGVWIDSPSTVKNEFLSHFANRFDRPSSTHLLLDMNFPNHISSDTKADLEKKSMFKGVSIGSTLHLSHLFYADDVGFMRKWSNSNFSTIVNVLKCFFHASGLRINMHKSKLIGNAVDDVKLKQVAHSLGCLQLEPPFSNLGTKIRGLMSRINSWDEIVNKLLAHLSKWKMKTLSIGGRLTLLKLVRFFNGVDVNEKKISWFRWNKVLASKEKELLKLYMVMTVFSVFLVKSSLLSIWLDIIRELINLKNQAINLLGLIKKKIRNGFDTSFWEDTWKGDIAFKYLYPRVFELESSNQISVTSKLAHENIVFSLHCFLKGSAKLEQYSDLMNSLNGFQLPNMQDRWDQVFGHEGELGNRFVHGRVGSCQVFDESLDMDLWLWEDAENIMLLCNLLMKNGTE